jgi:hypothetical protein
LKPVNIYENIRIANSEAAMRHFPAGAATPPRGAVSRLLDREPDPARRPHGPALTQPEADALAQCFNSWAFKREQPDSPERLNAAVAAAIERDSPLAFVLYWGRGRRDGVAAPERQCLDFLASLAARVRSLHGPGADMTIICTDTHAALNGHSALSTRRYFGEVEREAAARGFRTCFLGDLLIWAEGRIDAARAFDPPSPEVLRGLTASAAKHYVGGQSPEDAARLYYQANMIEKQAVEAVFPDAIFITFNGSALRPLFPDRMPIFYMYSIRRGVAVKPWFMAAEPEGAARPSEMVL